jgi:hypothetical protein
MMFWYGNHCAFQQMGLGWIGIPGPSPCLWADDQGRLRVEAARWPGSLAPRAEHKRRLV